MDCLDVCLPELSVMMLISSLHKTRPPLGSLAMVGSKCLPVENKSTALPVLTYMIKCNHIHYTLLSNANSWYNDYQMWGQQDSSAGGCLVGKSMILSTFIYYIVFMWTYLTFAYSDLPV